ncbi:hypothetical protein ABZP36_003489 [Zizania latifolia]
MLPPRRRRSTSSLSSPPPGPPTPAPCTLHPAPCSPALLLDTADLSGERQRNWRREKGRRARMFSGDWTPPCGSCCSKKYAGLVQIPCQCLRPCPGPASGFGLIETNGSFVSLCHSGAIGIGFAGRVFCKKGCDADGDTWDECISKCTEICYKDPVLEDQQWSAYIDRSPGQDSYSLECFNACVSGCGFRFDMPADKVQKIKPNRPSKPLPPPAIEWATNSEPLVKGEDLPCTSA